MMEFICSLPVLASLLSPCLPPEPLAVGYVEGEYVLIAPIETARLETVTVRRGDRVIAGQNLALLERRDAEIATAEARAAIAQAESHLANLRIGRRPEEIAVIEAELAAALAMAAEARRAVERQSDLLRRRIVSQAAYDAATTALEQAGAKVKQLQANLATARLPARPDEIKAAEAAVDQARAALDRAEWRLHNRVLTATEPGMVFDIIRNPGEVAGPQSPVLSILPDGAVKLRLYLAEAALSAVGTGTRLTVRCDGCGEGMSATVTYVSPDPEFTPPVIYSLENRQKLVYLVEAAPEGDATALKPGQIVDVDLAGGGQ